METFIVLRFIVQKLNTTLLGKAVEDADRCFLQQSWAACLEKSHWQGETGKWGQDPAFSGLLCPSDLWLRQGLQDQKLSQLKYLVFSFSVLCH